MKRPVSALIAGGLALVLLTTASPVQAASAEGDDSLSSAMEVALEPQTLPGGLPVPDVVFDTEAEAGKLPGVTTQIYVRPTAIGGHAVTPAAYGQGYVIGRARSWMTASNGYVRKGYSSGTLSAIGAMLLAFVPGVAAVSVSTILSIVSIVASSSNTVSGETLVSYRYLYRDGEGRWSSDPNTSGYWHLGYRTGRIETYKCVIGGRRNPTTYIWTFSTKNYNTSPATATNSPNYTQSNTWLASKGQSYVTAGTSYIETSW